MSETLSPPGLKPSADSTKSPHPPHFYPAWVTCQENALSCPLLFGPLASGIQGSSLAMFRDTSWHMNPAQDPVFFFPELDLLSGDLKSESNFIITALHSCCREEKYTKEREKGSLESL